MLKVWVNNKERSQHGIEESQVHVHYAGQGLSCPKLLFLYPLRMHAEDFPLSQPPPSPPKDYWRRNATMKEKKEFHHDFELTETKKFSIYNVP